MGSQRKKKRKKVNRDRYSSGLQKPHTYPFSISELGFPLTIYGAKSIQQPSGNFIPMERPIPEGGCIYCGFSAMPGENTCFTHHSK
jgi:hypothetical protein